MTDKLYRHDHPDAPTRDAEYVGTLGAHALTGEFSNARRGIELTVRDGDRHAGSALLFYDGHCQYSGEVTIGDAAFEMVARPEGVGIRRHWGLTLHEVVA